MILQNYLHLRLLHTLPQTAGRKPHAAPVEHISTFSAFPLMAQWNSQIFHLRAA